MSNNGKRKKQTVDVKTGNAQASGNVLDLRSIAAKKQVEKAQRERKLKEMAAKKAVKASKTRKKKKQKATSTTATPKAKPAAKAAKVAKPKKRLAATPKPKKKKVEHDFGDQMLMSLEHSSVASESVQPSKQELDFWNEDGVDAAKMSSSSRQLRKQRKKERAEKRKQREDIRAEHRAAVQEARIQAREAAQTEKAQKKKKQSDTRTLKTEAKTASKKVNKKTKATKSKKAEKLAAKAAKQKRADQRKKRAPKTKQEMAGSGVWARPIADTALDRAQKKADKKKLPSFGFSFEAFGKPLIGFALLALVFVIPASVSAVLNKGGGLENVVVQGAEEAFGHLQQAGDDLQGLQFGEAQQQFASAGLAFEQANAEIENLNGVVASAAKYIPGKGKTFYSGVHLLAAGEELAAAGELLSAAMDELNSVDLQAVARDENAGITSLLLVIHSALDPANQHIQSAVEHMSEVDPSSVPAEYQDLIVQAQDMLPLVADTVSESLGTTELLLSFLGHDAQKRYLVLFQNNYELRPTGGFIGSVALIDISNGVVTGLEVPGGGVYDIAGQQRAQVVSPAPLHLVNPHWNIQDANWFPHFPSSALKVQDFFESARQPSVDGVITLVPSVIEELIGATGPIDMTEEFDVVITEDNFYEEVQVRAEEKYDVTTESKKIIGEMTPLLFNNLFSAAEDPEQLVEIATVVRDAMIRKDILVYMNDTEAQQLFSDRDWSGELKETDRDYLGVFHANIGGGKTSQAVEEVVKHHARIDEDGTVVNTVTLTRVHKGDPESELEGEVNTDYVRFYVPEGSVLLAADGFESPDPALFMKPISTYDTDEDLEAVQGDVLLNTTTGISKNTEYGKTVFGGWTRTAPNESSTITIEYRLPFTIETNKFWQATDRYSLLVQKQPGYDVFFTSDVTLPSNMQVLRRYPDTYTGNTQLLLTEDYFVGMLLTRS